MVKVVGVTFASNPRMYYFASNDLVLKLNDNVIVETEKGLQYGIITKEEKEMPETSLFGPLKPVLRLATKEDNKKQAKNLKDRNQALETAKRLAKELKLDMRLLDANFTFDRNQLLFNFLADERVDFRELAKRLAQLYRTRIELRQIGVRDKAKEVGGIGPCGRFLCCNSFLTNFNSVSINMAKNQYIALNPTKINGVCGRLLCCLNYEDEQYTELKKNLPEVGNIVNTPQGRGKVISVDIFKHKYKVDIESVGIVEISE